MIHPVIFAGNTGKNIWPASGQTYPRQAPKIFDRSSLFQDTAQRYKGGSFEAPVVVVETQFAPIMADQLGEVGIRGAMFMPQVSTAPVALEVLRTALAMRETPQAVLLVVPSDQRVRKHTDLRDAALIGEAMANRGQLVTFGITPTRAATSYGYLEVSAAPTQGEAQPVQACVNAPTREQAQHMLASGRHLWHSGVFMARVDLILEAFAIGLPDVYATVLDELDDPAFADWEIDRTNDLFAGREDLTLEDIMRSVEIDICVVPIDGRNESARANPAEAPLENADAIEPAANGTLIRLPLLADPEINAECGLPMIFAEQATLGHWDHPHHSHVRKAA